MLTRSAVGYLVAAALFLVLLVDGGSVLLTQMSVPDDTDAAGHIGASAVENLPANKLNAIAAFEAAQAAGADNSLRVHTKNFKLYPDGQVGLTTSRTAPTMVFHRLPWFRDLAVVTSSSTVGPLPYD